MTKEILKQQLHKYFTALVHYQYDVNNGIEGAKEAFSEQQEHLDEEFMSLLSQYESEKQQELVRRIDLEKVECVDHDSFICECAMNDKFNKGLRVAIEKVRGK